MRQDSGDEGSGTCTPELWVPLNATWLSQVETDLREENFTHGIPLRGGGGNTGREAAGTGQRKVLRVAGEEMDDIQSPQSVLCYDGDKLTPTLSSFCQPLQTTEGTVCFLSCFLFLTSWRDPERQTGVCVGLAFSGTEKTKASHSW